MTRQTSKTKIARPSSLGIEELAEEEILQEMAIAEDLDPFCAETEIRHVEFLLQFANSRAVAASGGTKSSNGMNAADAFRAWYRRKDGLAGIRQFVNERLEQCKTILCPAQTDCGVAMSSGSTVDNRTVSADQHAWVRRLSPPELPSDRRPLFELALRLSQLDEFLCTLESSNDSKGDHEPPDVAACVGAGLAFGLALGHLATKVLFREALERDAAMQEKRIKGNEKNAWQSQHPKEAARVVSQVLHLSLEDGRTWQSAFARAGVGGDFKLPDVTTIRRTVYREIGLLLKEIRASTGRRRSSITAACTQVADARNAQGYMLTPELLRKLYDMDCRGILPGPNRNWMDQILSGRVSKELCQDLVALSRYYDVSTGDIMNAAFDTYGEST